MMLAKELLKLGINPAVTDDGRLVRFLKAYFELNHNQYIFQELEQAEQDIREGYLLEADLPESLCVLRLFSAMLLEEKS